MTHTPRYVIVTPVRDEAAYVEETLRSVTSQTVPPTCWVIVDDGSTDDTPAIIERYALEFPYIHLMRLGERSYGNGADRLSWGTDAVVFNIGLRSVDWRDFDYVCKLDADVRFEPDYYERLFEKFDEDPRLGIAGGHFYDVHGDDLVLDRVPDWHVRGATKVYRKACFEAIGGVQDILSWDTIDQVRAQMTGWYSRAYYEPRVAHLKPQGAMGGIYRGRMRLGIGSYVLRYHPLFVAARAGRMVFQRPYITGAAGYLHGYVKACVLRPPRLSDDEVAAELRRGQLQRLRGKSPFAMSGQELGDR